METPLTKKERYLLKRQQKEKECFRKARKIKIKKIIFVALPILLLLGGGILFLINYSSGNNNEGTPRIEMNPAEYDIGTISMAEGLVKKTYEIKNTGGGDLKIDKIWTSCDCTTARLKVKDKESPEFGMHTSSLLWSQKIAPGETGFLEATFDPAFHGPQGTGPAVRIVYLSTNDPQNPKAEAKLFANVTP